MARPSKVAGDGGELLAVFSVHLDAVDQLVSVGKMLGFEALFEHHGGIDFSCETIILPALRRGR